MSRIRFTSFPGTQAPPLFTAEVVQVFRAAEQSICTTTLAKGLTSDGVLGIIRPRLVELGFSVEMGKLANEKVRRPVFFGENGAPDLQYEIDAFHLDVWWRDWRRPAAAAGGAGGRPR